MKKIIASFIAIIFVSFVASVISSTPSFAGRQQPNNFPEAAGQVNDLCGDPNNPVAFAAYVSDLTFNDTTGAANYTINILWRKCRNPETRAFAVVGNGNNESKRAICPMVGRYGNNADTYDCVKYTSNPRFTDNGGLSCDNGKRDAECINGDFGRIERQENEPGYGIIQTSLGMSSSVDPGRLQTSGSQTFGGTDVLCAFYKANKSIQTPGRMCQDLFITVSWSRPWTINGQSYIKNSPDASLNGLQQGTISALPGDRLNWYHDMRNNGPNNTPNIYFNVDKTGFSNGWNDTKDPKGNASGRAGDLFVREYADRPAPYTLYDVTQNDVGNTLCQRISWNPASHDNTAGWGSSNYACANVPYRYNLTPSISGVTDGAAADSTGPIQIDGYISNDGPTKSRPRLDWQVSQIVYPPSPGNPPQNSGGTGATPCTFFTGEKQCRPIGNGTIEAGLLPGNHGPFIGNGEITDEPVGSKICFVMSVRQYNQDANDWRHSALSCRIISKSPKVQIRGGDVVVGKGTSSKIATSITRKGAGADERTFGSWGEYAVIASGRVYGMASGAGYAGQGATERAFCTVSYLTIANAGNNRCSDSTDKGVYTFGGALPSVGARFTGGVNRGANPTINLADDDTKGIITATGTIRLEASKEIAAGKSIIINAPTANVLITSNISYTGAQLTSINELPQVVIIANNISIQGNVAQVDAWLVASGVSGQIITCSDVANFTSLNSNTCGTPLAVNGPVAARQLFLYRTAGSGVDRESGNPADLFNLRPDAYLWASNYNSGSNRLETATSSELPPRF